MRVKKLIEKIFHKIELASLKAECDLLAYAYNDLMSWAEYVSIKNSEMYMIIDALENPAFKETTNEFKFKVGYRETYEELLNRMKNVLKKREMI